MKNHINMTEVSALKSPVKNAIKNVCGKVSDMIFSGSSETAFVMLVFNAIGIISSHLAQIGGLKKSKRENKDYLIIQEEKELGLDICLTIIPPFIINNILKKKLESGALTTKEAKSKLTDIVAPAAGVSKKDLYSTAHIKSFKENILSSAVKITNNILKKGGKVMPAKSLKKLTALKNKLEAKLPDYSHIPPSLEDIAASFDNMAKTKNIDKKIKGSLRNGSAYDELCGLNNGILIAATLGYTIIASNIIMPILKNKLSNRTYEKELARAGETKGSIKRKQRFAFNDAPIIPKDTYGIFSDFSDNDNLKDISSENIKKTDKTIQDNTAVNSPFESFEKYNGIISQSTGLKI